MAETHKPGETVPRDAGREWRCTTCGHTIDVRDGDVFPPCPRCGPPIEWEDVRP